MAEHLKADPEELRGYGQLLERNAGHFKTIEQYATDVASDPSGFTGLLAVLVPAVRGVSQLYGQGLEYAHQALSKVREELHNTAQHYEDFEKKAGQELKAIEAELDKLRISGGRSG